jgi:uncharacterized protein (DUF1330 family)
MPQRTVGAWLTHGGILEIMTAYVISEVEVLDEATADRYRALAETSIVAHGGHYVVRGAMPELLEGDWPGQQRVVVVAFPTVEAARAWYASPEYTEALEMRHLALNRRLLLVDGV